MPRLIVIGGGISGLSAAHHACRKYPGTHITLIETESYLGGKIITERVPFDDAAFIVEGGPDSFLAKKPWAVELCREIGLEGRLQGTNPETRNTYILYDGRLRPIPDGLSMLIPTDVRAMIGSRLISWPGKVRMGLDLLLPPKHAGQDESVGSFVSRRLGREAYDNLIEPLMSGIYAGDGHRLSLQSTFPQLQDFEGRFGSIARGALQARKLSNGHGDRNSRSVFLTPEGGLAELVEAIVHHLGTQGVSLRLGSRAVSLGRSRGQDWMVSLEGGDVLDADGVILATPAFVSADILTEVDPRIAEALRSIQYVSTATISLAYRQGDLPRALDGYGYVIPRRERRPVLACTWTSSKFPGRAPDGYALVRIFIGRADQEPAPDDGSLLEQATDELRRTLGIRAEPLFHRIYRWEKAMPQYNVGHSEVLERIDTALAGHPGLALAGSGYRGIGIPDCIHSGQVAVDRVLGRLQAARRDSEL